MSRDLKSCQNNGKCHVTLEKWRKMSRDLEKTIKKCHVTLKTVKMAIKNIVTLEKLSKQYK